MEESRQGRFVVERAPSSEAPDKYRKAWVGVTLYYSYQDCFQPEKGILTKKVIERRCKLIVPRDGALKMLKMKNPKAAKWFEDHSKPGDNFAFGKDEVEIKEYAEGQKIIEVTDEMQGDPYR